MKRKEKLVDQNVWDLAARFAADVDPYASDYQIQQLAEVIQQAIEDELSTWVKA